MTANIPLVSVLMTSYNREKYIGNAIESVLKSTFTNFELIVVDDGSKDKTVEIAKQFAAKDPRVKVYINVKNLGDYPNRNKAASYATGKYLKYVDSDDFIYSTGLQVLVSMMENNPSADWGLCTIKPNFKQPFPILLQPKEIFEYHYLGAGLFYNGPLSSIIKKSAFDAVGGFKEYRMVGDFEMWHRLAINYNVLLMPQGVVWYREHNEQEINSIKKYWLDYDSITKHYITHPKSPFTNTQKINLIKKNRLKNLRSVVTLTLKGQFQTAKNRLAGARIFSNDLHTPLAEKIN
ncbi:MAG: glycosyltransferase family 2 protein [Chitinophagaceae bacterium]